MHIGAWKPSSPITFAQLYSEPPYQKSRTVYWLHTRHSFLAVYSTSPTPMSVSAEPSEVCGPLRVNRGHAWIKISLVEYMKHHHPICNLRNKQNIEKYNLLLSEISCIYLRPSQQPLRFSTCGVYLFGKNILAVVIYCSIYLFYFRLLALKAIGSIGHLVGNCVR